jgi:hypothetical protein
MMCPGETDLLQLFRLRFADRREIDDLSHVPNASVKKSFASFFSSSSSRSLPGNRIVSRDLSQRGDTEIDGSLKMEPDRSLLASVRDYRFKQLRICVWV